MTENKALLLSNLCKDYYLENKTIHDLSQKYDLSRYKILKFLEEAKKDGIVHIDIQEQFERHIDLEERLHTYFDVHFFVLKENGSFVEHDLLFWKFCAFHIQQLLITDEIIGLSFGESLYKTIEQFMPSYEGKRMFVPFLGDNQRFNTISNSSFIAYQCAKIYHGHYRKLSCPLYTQNQALKSLLLQETCLQETLNLARKADTLLTGLATPAAIEAIPFWNACKRDLFSNLDSAVGFIFGRPFAIDGHFLVNPTQDPVLGLNLADIYQVPKRCVLCNHKFKAQAMIGALRTGTLTHAILNEASAAKMLHLLLQEEDNSK